jgi:dihydroflavonol-4-reductase
MLSGTNVAFSEIISTLEDLTGRRIPHLTLPAGALRPVVRTAGLLQRALPFRLPLNEEGFETIVWNPRGDDSDARADLGFAPRPVRETLADTVAWLYRAGHLSPRQAGKLASSV